MPPSAMLFNEENTCKCFWKEDLTYLRYSVKREPSPYATRHLLSRRRIGLMFGASEANKNPNPKTTLFYHGINMLKLLLI